MKHSTVEERKEIFIQGMIEAQSLPEQIAAYKKAYPTCKTDNGARVNCYRMLQNATISAAITKGKQEKEEIIREAKKQERIRIAREGVAHELELDAILSSIALGEFKRKRKVPVFNRESKSFEVVSIEETPTEADIIAAADKLYKRKDSYRKTIKLEHTGAGGQPIQVENSNKNNIDFTKLSDEVIESILNARIKPQ